jgi:oligoendopeptidase F
VQRLTYALAMSCILVAKDPVKTPPDFSQLHRSTIPSEHTWKVDDLFPSEEAWRKELEAVKAEAAKVPKRAQGWTKTASSMADLLILVSDLDRRIDLLGSYAARLSDTDMGNSAYQKLKGEVQALAVGYNASLAFIEPDVLKLGREQVETNLRVESRLTPYRFPLEKILRQAPHILPASEQKIASLTGHFAGAPSKAAGLLNNLDLPRGTVVLQDGSGVPLDQAGYQKHRASKVAEDRRKVMETFWTNQKTFENTFAALQDGTVKNHHFEAQVHAYEDCLTAALDPNAIDPKVYTSLIEAVRANLAPMHRLLRLRQRLLNLPEFRYGDIYASAVASVDKQYSYDEAKALVVDACKPLGHEYTGLLQKAFDKRWVDVYPNKGKRSGAYSSGAYGIHPFVLMNFGGSYRDVSTLAHELGHALHSYSSNATQSYPVAQYPIFLAEIASTFNENLLMHKLLASEKDDKLKLYLLDTYLEGLRGTLYRQTLFADFELRMHRQVEKGQSLTPDWLNANYLELTRFYYGHEQGVVKVEDYIQNEWSGIPHFHYNFYVYQYATGIVASMALADAVLKEGEPARERYLEFLRAGGSADPLDTLRKAGVDLTKPEALRGAFRVFETYVDEMEQIVARLERK